MPPRSLQQVSEGFWPRRLAAFAICFCAALAVGQLPKDPVLDGWDSQYFSAPLQAQTIAARNRVQAEIDAYMKAHTLDRSAYRTCALGYNHLGENDDAVAVLRVFLQRFPNDVSNDALMLTLFSNYGTTQDIMSVPAHVKNQPNYWSMTLPTLERDHASPALLKQAGTEDLRRFPRDKDKDGGERINVAEIWLRTGVDPYAAEHVAREAVRISEIGPPPDILVTNQRDRMIFDRLEVRSINRSTLGWALYKEGRYAEARTELERAAQLARSSSFSTSDVFFRLGQTLERLGQPQQAMVAYDKEMAWGNPHSSAESRRAAVYKELHGSLQGLDTDDLNRINALAMQRSKDDTALLSNLDQDLGRFSLLDEHGKALDLTSYRGKLVLVDFWATWCGQCLLTMKQVDVLQKRYPGQLVVVAPDQDPELTRTKAHEYLDKMGYKFVLVYDDDKRRQIRLPYIPARLLLDQKGHVRFMELGATAEGGVLLENKINELLRASHSLPLKNGAS
jgi:thiol-disulfide isomerase/thioredoxin